MGTGYWRPPVAFNPPAAETTTLFVLTRSVLFLMTVVNISIGVDNKAEVTYLGFRSDLKNAGVDVPIGAEERMKQPGEGEAKSSWLADSRMSCSLFWGWPKTHRCRGVKRPSPARVCVHGHSCRLDSVPGRADTSSRLHRTWRCHGRDRAWRGYQQRVCVWTATLSVRACV